MINSELNFQWRFNNDELLTINLCCSSHHASANRENSCVWALSKKLSFPTSKDKILYIDLYRFIKIYSWSLLIRNCSLRKMDIDFFLMLIEKSVKGVLNYIFNIKKCFLDRNVEWRFSTWNFRNLRHFCVNFVLV